MMNLKTIGIFLLASFFLVVSGTTFAAAAAAQSQLLSNADFMKKIEKTAPSISEDEIFRVVLDDINYNSKFTATEQQEILTILKESESKFYSLRSDLDMKYETSSAASIKRRSALGNAVLAASTAFNNERNSILTEINDKLQPKTQEEFTARVDRLGGKIS